VTPSWYDLLGVSPEASSAEIRAAWKDAIADLDPTDRRFRVLNEAAEVLLDPERRAEYDRELARELAPEPATRQDVTGGAERGRSLADVSGETQGDPQPRQAKQEEQDSPTTVRRGVPGWVLVAVGVLTTAMVVLAAWLYTQPSDEAVRTATTEAQGAAERAAVTILAYDYRTMDADQEASGRLMTADYRKKYDQLFEVLKENAAEVKPVVTVEPVVASGIVRSGDDRVQVLVFVNRPTTNAQNKEPRIFRDQVTLTMEKVGGDWLVDDLITDPPAA
jgi:Mce-associated membrane protein